MRLKRSSPTRSILHVRCLILYLQGCLQLIQLRICCALQLKHSRKICSKLLHLIHTALVISLQFFHLVHISLVISLQFLQYGSVNHGVE